MTTTEELSVYTDAVRLLREAARELDAYATADDPHLNEDRVSELEDKAHECATAADALEDRQREVAIDSLRDDLHERIMAHLHKIQTVVVESGFYADEPATMHDDTYRWTFTVWRDGQQFAKREYTENGCADITLVLAESMQYDGEEKFGVNFGLDIVAYGGRILGGMTPYNYTDEVWVDARDREATIERWELHERADLDSIPELLGGLESGE